MLKKWFGKTMLKLFGWKIKGNFPFDIKKFVVVVAPHTSNMDFYIGHLYNFFVNMHPTVMIKKELFVFPINIILRALGGVPVDRKSTKGYVEQIAEEFGKREQFRLVITPEGTRKKNGKWKTGFLRIAYMAKVPILLTFIDYKKKELGVLSLYQPTYDLETDMQNIKNYYKDITAKHPEQFSIDDKDAYVKK